MTIATARARYREHTWESVHASAMKASPYRPGGPLPYAQLVRGRKVPKTAHLTRRAEREIRQLRTGHHELLHNRYRKDWEDLAAEERQRVRPCELCDATPVCPITHLFLECKIGYAMRAPMWRQVFEADPKVPREQDAGLVARYQILEDPPDPQTPAFHETPQAGGPNFADALDLDATSSATSSTAWHAFNGEAWGMDLFPTYGGGRAERAARWAVFNDATEKKKGKKTAVVGGDPWYVPEGVPRHEKWARKVVPRHQKVKCDACKRQGKSVAWCCKAHHKEDDGLAVKFCAQHRLTQCATCKTIAEWTPPVP
ncbi:hypothetical protein DIPPA_14763 [Diplonema papillatum]|nr:hypothetical protein DIPPA_35667 [Diplonema papillatum]KAJ9440634.1 hypothetical protein DIPPA_14763 [Diplonema papillatum]